MNMALSDAHLRYLFAISNAAAATPDVSSRQIASTLGVTKPSVVHILNILMRDGMVVKRHYGKIYLTDRGAFTVNYYRRLLRGTSCVLFPIMGAIVALAVPGVRLVLTEKWMPAAPLLQILATACVMAPIRMINQNVYHIKGRSDIYLKTEVINKLLITALLAATIPLGIQAICWGFLAVSYVQFFVNAHYNSRLVGYHLRRQLGDIGRPLLVTLVMTAAIFGLTLLIRHDLAAILAGGAVMLATSAWMLNREVRIRTLYAKFFHKA